MSASTDIFWILCTEKKANRPGIFWLSVNVHRTSHKRCYRYDDLHWPYTSTWIYRFHVINVGSLIYPYNDRVIPGILRGIHYGWTTLLKIRHYFKLRTRNYKSLVLLMSYHTGYIPRKIIHKFLLVITASPSYVRVKQNHPIWGLFIVPNFITNSGLSSLH